MTGYLSLGRRLAVTGRIRDIGQNVLQYSFKQESVAAQLLPHFLPYHIPPEGDSSVGIATRYGLYGPDIESRWGRDFPYPYRSAVGPTQPAIQRVPGLFRG